MVCFSPGVHARGIRTSLSILFLILCFASPALANDAVAEIESMTWSAVGTQVEVRIKGSRPLISTTYELPNPPRIIVDIAEARAADSLAARFPAHEALNCKKCKL